MKEKELLRIIGINRKCNVWKIKTTKKNKELWLRRGLKFIDSYKLFDVYYGYIIVRIWEEKENSLFLEVIYSNKTDWFTNKNGKWTSYC